ncbi:MAG: serine/threonine protein kinase [Planctomycetota bacterium]|jgi:serine/threonine protein kinase
MTESSDTEGHDDQTVPHDESSADAETLPFESTIPLNEADRPEEVMFDGRYRVVKLLGEGGFGKVFVVEDTLHGDERLALKLVKPEHAERDEFALRFQNEIRVLRSMQHEGIPQIFNDGKTDDGEVYFTMALVPGRSLDEVLKEKRVLAPMVVADYVRQIVAILEYAHGRGIVHRDLKPANVLLVNEGTDHEQLKVLDFGIAKILRKEGTLAQALTMETQMPIGTPHYMAPEQVRGRDVDGRTDLYALGIMIHRMVSGKYPFEGGTAMEILTARLEDDPKPAHLKEETGTLSKLVGELLARDKNNRPNGDRIEELLVSALAGRQETNTLLRFLSGFIVLSAVTAAFLVWKPWETDEPGVVPQSTAKQANRDDSKSPIEPSKSQAVTDDPNEEPSVLTPIDLEANNPPTKSTDPDLPGLSVDTPNPVITPEFTKTEPAPVAAPVIPSLVQFTPEDRSTLAFKDTIPVSGSANHPLSRATVNGIEVQVNGNSFSADFTLDQLIDNDGRFEVQLWGVDEVASETFRRQIDLPEALVPHGCSLADGATFTTKGWASSVVHKRSNIQLVFVESAGEGFYIGMTEVTWNQYEAFASIDKPKAFTPASDHPVVGVSFQEAVDFCERTGLELPTSEEWLAAGARTPGDLYPWGNDWGAGSCNGSESVTKDGFEHTSPAIKLISADGAADVTWTQAIGFAGNVTEWCSEDGKPALYGGSYEDDADGCTLTARRGFMPRGGARHIGFRVVVRLK